MKKIFIWLAVVVAVFIASPLLYITLYFQRIGVVSEGQKIEQGLPEKSALLVIDIQEGATGKYASPIFHGLVKQSEPFIQKVNQAVEKAQSLKIPVIYIRQESTDKILNLLTRQLLAAGNPSAALDPRVHVVEGPAFVKHMMDTFTNPEFEAFLKKEGVNHLYITGLDATACVDRTIQGALKRGYAVTAISDAIISNTAGQKEKMCRKWQQKKVTVIGLDQWQKI